MQVELLALLGTIAAACAVNQILHLILEGSLFTGLREWAKHVEYGAEPHGLPREKDGLFPAYVRGLFDCRLCFAQEIAIAVTWVFLVTAYSVNRDLTSVQGWAAAAVFGPFIVGGVDWILNSCREK